MFLSVLVPGIALVRIAFAALNTEQLTTFTPTCLGQKFAVLELKSLVFKMLKNFELKLPENHEDPVLVATLILRPQHGMPLKIVNRVF